MYKRQILALKFLDGDVNYDQEVGALQEWLQSASNPIDMIEAFRIIHTRRGKQPLLGSDMEFVIGQISANFLA